MQERFPRIESGEYVGHINGIFVNNAESKVPFYLKSDAETGLLVVAILKDGWAPQRIVTVGRDSTKTEKLFFPVTVSGVEGSLKFTGVEASSEHYSGNVSWVGKKSKGNWSLEPLISSPVKDDEQPASNLSRWLNLKRELDDVDGLIANLSSSIPQQEDQIDKLSVFVAEGDDLKKRATQKFEQVQLEADQALKILKEKQAQANELQQKIVVSEKVTSVGKLVSLSRESLEREYRWVESVLRSGGDRPSADLQNALVKGEEILKIKRAIAAESGRISSLERSLDNQVEVSPGLDNAGRTDD